MKNIEQIEAQLADAQQRIANLEQALFIVAGTLGPHFGGHVANLPFPNIADPSPAAIAQWLRDVSLWALSSNVAEAAAQARDDQIRSEPESEFLRRLREWSRTDEPAKE